MGQMSPYELEGLLEQEISAIENLLLPSRSMQRTAEALPGFGIFAAVMGIIITVAIDGSIAMIGYPLLPHWSVLFLEFLAVIAFLILPMPWHSALNAICRI